MSVRQPRCGMQDVAESPWPVDRATVDVGEQAAVSKTVYARPLGVSRDWEADARARRGSRPQIHRGHYGTTAESRARVTGRTAPTPRSGWSAAWGGRITPGSVPAAAARRPGRRRGSPCDQAQQVGRAREDLRQRDVAEGQRREDDADDRLAGDQPGGEQRAGVVGPVLVLLGPLAGAPRPGRAAP